MEWVSWWISGKTFKEENPKYKGQEVEKNHAFFFFFSPEGTLTSYSTESVEGSRGSPGI